MISLNLLELQELVSGLIDSKFLLPEDSRFIMGINKDGVSPKTKEDYQKGYNIEFIESDSFMITTVNIKIEKRLLLFESEESIKRNLKFRETITS